MSKVKKLFGGGGGNASNDAAAAAEKRAAEARAAEAARQARINAGLSNINSNFSQFDDDFFNDISDNYFAFSTPQLDEQLEQAKKELTFALARGGNTESTAANDKFAELAKKDELARLDLRAQGDGFANERRSAVNSARSALTSELTATANPNLTASSLQSRLPALTQAPSFSPIGTFFQNISAGLATANEAQRDAESTRLLQDAISGLTSPVSSGSGRTVG